MASGRPIVRNLDKLGLVPTGIWNPEIWDLSTQTTYKPVF